MLQSALFARERYNRGPPVGCAHHGLRSAASSLSGGVDSSLLYIVPSQNLIRNPADKVLTRDTGFEPHQSSSSPAPQPADSRPEKLTRAQGCSLKQEDREIPWQTGPDAQADGDRNRKMDSDKPTRGEPLRPVAPCAAGEADEKHDCRDQPETAHMSSLSLCLAKTSVACQNLVCGAWLEATTRH